MLYLAAASLMWAFSFGLIKHHLAGIDPNAVAFIRLAISLLIFLPLWRPRRIPVPAALKLIAIGAIQYGLMYTAYIHAYRYLAGYQVALLTIFTPIYVALIYDALDRHLIRRHLAAAALAAAGGFVIFFRQGTAAPAVRGILLMQLSNFAFAFGQIAYRRTTAKLQQLESASIMTDTAWYAWLFLGAAIFTGIVSLFCTDLHSVTITHKQWLVLLYLGVLPSGIAFFLWNLGSCRVNPATLAVFNNIKIPLAVTVTLLFFGEQAEILRLLAGSAVIFAALAIALRKNAQPPGRQS